MAFSTPPGIPYVCRTLPRLLVPATVVYVGTSIADYALDIQTPLALRITACVLSLPATFYLSLLWMDIRIKRRADALGAELPPMVQGKLPGGIDRIIEGSKLRNTMYPGDKVDDWLEEHGNVFNLRLMFANRIVTAEPEYIKSILATDFENFEKGETLQAVLEPLFGTGVFNSDGERWKFHRSMTRPFFTKEKIRHFQIFERHAEDAINQMKERLRSGYAIDIQDVVSKFTLDSATEFLFGTDVHSLSAGLEFPPNQTPKDLVTQPSLNGFAEAFVNAQEFAARRMDLSTAWPLAEFWVDRVKPHMDKVTAFIKPIVEAAIAKKRRGEKTDEEETLLEQLVALTEDPKLIQDETLNIMLAGKDTTGSTLTYAMGTLAQHPEILARLREEILARVGPTKMPTYDDLREMKYLRAVINETLRLYPPVPFNIRYSINEMVWPSTTGGKPVYVPERTMCVYSVFLMHRRKDLWGPDALEFDPDRFLDDRMKKYLTPNPFIFLPFNAGPRICLGQQFAYNEVSLMLVKLLQSFSEITLDPEASPASNPPAVWATGKGRRPQEKIWLRSHMTLHAHNGCWMRLKEAENVEA